MNIRHLSIEITPPTFANPEGFVECRVEVVADDQRFSYIEVVPKDDFIPYFERLMDYARATIIVAVKDHEHGVKGTKDRRPRKNS